MAFPGRFEPQPYEPSLFGAGGFVLYGNLRNRDAILHQILIGPLEAFISSLVLPSGISCVISFLHTLLLLGCNHPTEMQR